MAEKWTDEKMPSGRTIPRIPQKETGPHGTGERSPETPKQRERNEERKEHQKQGSQTKDTCDDDRFQATDN